MEAFTQDLWGYFQSFVDIEDFRTILTASPTLNQTIWMSASSLSFNKSNKESSHLLLRRSSTITKLNISQELTDQQILSFSSLHSLTDLTIKVETAPDTLLFPPLTNLTSLSIPPKGLGGLSSFPNLKILKSTHVNSEFDSITTATNLTILDLSFACIETLQPLLSLTKLTMLNLPYAELSNIQFISTLQQLKTLNISNQRLKPEVVQNFQPLGALTTLTNLNISYNNLTLGLLWISSLNSLQILDVWACLFKSLKETHVIMNLPNLQKLSLSTLQRTFEPSGPLLELSSSYLSVESLKCLPESVTALDFQHSRLVGSVDGFCRLTNLESLNVRRFENRDEIDFSCLAKLRYLGIYKNVNSLSSLQYLTNLKTLLASGCPIGIERVREIAILTQLTSLTLEIVDDEAIVGVLQSLTNLTELTLHTSFPDSLSVLTNLKRFKFFSSAKDFSFLKNWKQLTHLNLCQSNNEMLKTISGLPSLKKLELGNCDDLCGDSFVYLGQLKKVKVIRMGDFRSDPPDYAQEMQKLTDRGVVIEIKRPTKWLPYKDLGLW